MTPFYMFLIWIAIAIVFIVVEMLTFGFILVFFGVGAIIAGLCALIFNMAIGWQLVVFVIASILALALLRKFSLKTFRGNQTKGVEDNYHNSITGKVAVVTKAIIPPAPGEIKFSGTFWRAVAETAIDEGETVEIVTREHNDALTLKVKPAQTE